MPTFENITVNYDPEHTGEEIRSIVYHTMVGSHKQTYASKFAEESETLQNDRQAIIESAAKFVVLQEVAGTKATMEKNAARGYARLEPYDLENTDAAALAVIAWRNLKSPSGDQDRNQGKGPPLVTASNWFVTIDDNHRVERLDSFMARSAAHGWTVTSSTPLGTVEQNSSSEAFIPGLNLRDTRFSRILTQMIFLQRS